jgi:hypothetical protein
MEAQVIVRRALAALVLTWSAAFAAVREWGPDQTRPILDKMLVLRLSPGLDQLTAGERRALDALLAAGPPLQRVYERQLHRQALDAQRALAQRRPPREDLLTLYRLWQGPIAIDLENRREPFLAVDPVVPGKNVYPWGIDKARLQVFLEDHPEAKDDILNGRTVVREASDAPADLVALAARPALAALHPGLEARIRAGAAGFYAIPYALAYADDLDEAGAHLLEAAGAVRAVDQDLADYLENRRRDFLTNDYESGDASWVMGAFGNLNAQIGSFETYDDELFGVKSFMSHSVMVRDAERTRSLRAALRGLQAIEDALPCEPHRKVRESLPVGVYNVVADFGQARGTNTASILPNEPRITRKYGRTILLRYNVMTHPDLFAIAQAMWTAAVAPEHARDLGTEGGFYRTLWHEIGHYLGPDRDRGGRDLDLALQEDADLFEELKSDLVSLFAAQALRASGDFDETRLRDVQAAGILRVLQKNQPRRGQPYQTMQLMQMNFFLEGGLLRFDAAGGRLRIEYARYPAVVASMLEKVLAIQAAGDKAAADAFIDRYDAWTPELHERLGQAMRATERYRYRLVKYQALGE